LTKSFRPHCDTRIDSASERNEYRVCLLRCKRGQCVGSAIFLPYICRVPGSSARLLESKGPFQACIGTVYLCAGFSLKKTYSFSLYRRKNYHDQWRSVFVANF